MKTEINNQRSGQALLIIIMLLATVFTVVMATSFRSTTETQITKLEEESLKALSAAEAAMNIALKKKSSVSIGVGGDISFPGFTGTATFDNTKTNSFTSPLLQKDEQYTFYLSDYSIDTKLFSGSSTSQTINVCFNSTHALELTLVKSDFTIRRHIVNPRSSTIITNGSTASAASDCPSGTSFTEQYDIPAADVGVNTRLLIARIITDSSTTARVGIKATDVFPLQGSTIPASATSTNTGVTKSLTLFQSYPQIPAEFFVTSF